MKKFETANANGLIVECKSVSLGCLTKHLELHGPIIILIDSNQLCCEMCKTNKLNKDFRYFI